MRIDPVQRWQKDAQPTAIITQWSPTESSYRFVRRAALRNPHSPRIALITNDARFLVTFDDWFGIGNTDNAVVIYDFEKGSVHNYRVEDFLPKPFREKFPWRGKPFVNELEHTIYVELPDTTPDSKGFEPHIEIDLAKKRIWIRMEDKLER